MLGALTVGSLGPFQPLVHSHSIFPIRHLTQPNLPVITVWHLAFTSISVLTLSPPPPREDVEPDPDGLRWLGHRTPALAGDLARVQTDLHPAVEQGEERRQRAGCHEEAHEAELWHCGHGGGGRCQAPRWPWPANPDSTCPPQCLAHPMGLWQEWRQNALLI